MEVATEEQCRQSQVPGEQALFPLGCAYRAQLSQTPYRNFSVPGSRLAERLVHRLRNCSNPCPFRLVLLRFLLEMGVPATLQPVPAS